MRWGFVVSLTATLLFGMGIAADAATVRHVGCSVSDLRAAIIAANGAPGTVLKLHPHCTYSISDVSSSAGDGLPAIVSSMTIKGNGARIVRTATAQFRIFEIQSGATVSMSSLSIRGGHAPDGDMAAGGAGGGILNAGTLRLTNVTLAGNTSGAGGSVAGTAFNGGGGGGIANTGTLTVIRSRVVGNTTGVGAGGIVLSPGQGGNGGGIDDEGTLSVVASSIVKNRTGTGASNLGVSSSEGGNGAGLYIGSSANATIKRTVIKKNVAAPTNGTIGPGDGGGIFNASSTTIVPRATTIAANRPDNCAPAGRVARCRN